MQKIESISGQSEKTVESMNNLATAFEWAMRFGSDESAQRAARMLTRFMQSRGIEIDYIEYTES